MGLGRVSGIFPRNVSHGSFLTARALLSVLYVVGATESKGASVAVWRPSRLLLPECCSSPLERIVTPGILVAWVVVHGCSGVPCLLVGVKVRKSSGFAEEGFRKYLAVELH